MLIMESFSEQQSPRPPLQPGIIFSLLLLLRKSAGAAVERDSRCIRDSSMHIQPLYPNTPALNDSRIDELLDKSLHATNSLLSEDSNLQWQMLSLLS